MKSRLKQIREKLSLRQQDLAELLGCTKENIAMIERGKSAITQRNKSLITEKYNINPEWLDGREGPGIEMFLPSGEPFVEREKTAPYRPVRCPVFDARKIDNLNSLFRYTKAQRNAIENPQKRRGRKTKQQHMYEPEGWISFPDMPSCDGALKVYTEGMAPTLDRCETVIYSQLASTKEIIWGELYLVSIATSAGEYITVRYIRKPGNSPKTRLEKKPAKKVFFSSAKPQIASESVDYEAVPQTVILSTADPKIADMEVEMSKIRALALVKASIRVFSTK